MAKLIGVYNQQKTENLDAYYAAIGVPYIPRKMMSLTSPKLTISQEGDSWTLSTSTAIRTVTSTFKFGEEYVESMPKGALQSTTTLDGDNLITKSTGPDGTKIIRIYEPTETGCVLILKHEASGIEARRFFVRACRCVKSIIF